MLSDAAIVRRLLALTWVYRWRCSWVFSCQLVLLGLGLLGLSFTGLAIDLVRRELDPATPEVAWPWGIEPPASWGFPQIIALLAAAVLVMAALRALLNYWYSVEVAHLVQVQVVPKLRALVFDKLSRLSFRFFDANASGGIVNRVTGDVQSLRSFIDGVLIQGGIMLLSLGVYVAYMLGQHVTLTLACLSPMPALWWTTTRFSRRTQPAYARVRAETDELVLAFSESVEGMQVTKLFAAESLQAARFGEKNRSVFQRQLEVFRDVSRFGALVDGLGHVSLLILLVYGGWLVGRRELPLGDLVVFAGLLQQFSGQLQRTAGVVNTLQQSLAGARRVYEVLDAPLEIESPPEPIRVSHLTGRIRFENVSLAHVPGREVLVDVDLEVAPGTTVAIVGETGAGKSSLLSLLPRFYDPSAGRVLLDGHDVRTLDLDWMRRRIGVVFQSNLLFRDTVHGNIAFGHPEATEAQVWCAAQVARADEFIRGLPNGYATRVEQAASNLSGGQKQRLALARALLLGPAILLLDDPTSGIDGPTEQELIGALEEATRGRTTLIATHRIALARRADHIVVLHRGRIVERGTHHELLERAGLYREAAELQGLVEPRGPGMRS